MRDVGGTCVVEQALSPCGRGTTMTISCRSSGSFEKAGKILGRVNYTVLTIGFASPALDAKREWQHERAFYITVSGYMIFKNSVYFTYL